MPMRPESTKKSLLNMGRQQHGFALLTVLLVVAVVSILSAQILSSQQNQIQRSGFMLHQAQVFSVQWGMEEWVKTGLKLDIENNATDHLQELWAQPLPPVEFAEGTISGGLLDAQSKLNLNNVLAAEADQKALWQAILNRYVALGGGNALMTSTVDNTVTRQPINWPEFASLVTDWVDEDSEVSESGAESDQYLLRSPAHSVANQPMVIADEIRQLSRFSELDWQQQQNLLFDLVALPKVTPVNVNTASSEVLQALAPWMTPVIAQAWLLQRASTPAETVTEFMSFLETQTGFSAQEIQKDLPTSFISVASEFFRLEARLDYGLAENALMYALFYRNAQEVKLMQRWIGFDS